MSTQIDTDALRSLAVRARLTSRSISFGADDVEGVANELDTARQAVKKLGDYLAATRDLLTEAVKPGLLDAERKRLRGEADELLTRIGQMLGESKIEVVHDTILPPGSDVVQ